MLFGLLLLVVLKWLSHEAAEYQAEFQCLLLLLDLLLLMELPGPFTRPFTRHHPSSTCFDLVCWILCLVFTTCPTAKINDGDKTSWQWPRLCRWFSKEQSKVLLTNPFLSLLSSERRNDLYWLVCLICREDIQFYLMIRALERKTILQKSV